MTIKNDILVSKIGGAGLETSGRFREFPKTILPVDKSEKQIVVCSAVKGDTRLLMDLVDAKCKQDGPRAKENLKRFKQVHTDILIDLFGETDTFTDFFKLGFQELEELVFSNRKKKEVYPSVLHFGELFSSKINSLYLEKVGISNYWFNIRDYFKTSGDPSKAEIEEGVTTRLMKQHIPEMLERYNLLITQGFIATDAVSGQNSVLPLDGSDMTAAFITHAVDASRLELWKDVSVCKHAPMANGMNNIYEYLSYKEYGKIFAESPKAPVHLKAVEIVSRKSKPMYVRNFNTPEKIGTIIGPSRN